MRYRILGDDIQLVEILLEPGDVVQSETGSMTYMDAEVHMETTTGGGLLKGLKRMLAGESFFVTHFANRTSRPLLVAFAAAYPGKIIPLDLRTVGGAFLAQRASFLVATADVDISIAFTRRLGAGLFGGEGFILQRFDGAGQAFFNAGGTIVEKDLAAGQELRVDTGCIVGFAPSVTYDIQFVKGFKNILFGGEGLFLATLRGPGKVYLQSLPLARLADRILSAARHTGRGGGGETRGVAGLGGEIVKGFISGS